MTRTSVALAAAALLLGGLASPASASIFHVDDDGLDAFECEGAPFRTINQALAVANEGDEIRVCPGVYAEQVVLRYKIRLSGISFGTSQPIIKPVELPETRPSLLGANPVTAALIIDDEFVRVSNLEIDLADTTLGTCLPYLAGVYLRGASGAVDKLRISNVRVKGNPGCDSGVGLYIESGAEDEILGNPIFATARVSVRDVEVEGYQKAGIVGNGPRAVLNVKGGGVVGDGGSVGAVQYGYQFAFGAKGKIAGVTSSAHRSLITGKAAAGMLVYRASRVSIRKSDVFDAQEGVFNVGDRLRVKKTGFVNIFGDGIALFGNSNLAASNFVDGGSVSGVFILGDRNVVRGGVMRNGPVGVWFQSGVGNSYGGVRFENVPVAAQGVYGGVRSDLGIESAEPFSTECVTSADCDDANSCTADSCAKGHCTSTALPAGAACDDGNSCTTDVCAAGGVCQGSPLPAATACDDGNPCTAGDVCSAGGLCSGMTASVGTACDDGNPCTGADVCNGLGLCGGPAVLAGSLCDDGNPCTLGDSCDSGSVCRGQAALNNAACDDGNECTVEACQTAVCRTQPVPDFTACAGGTLACMAGVCS